MKVIVVSCIALVLLVACVESNYDAPDDCTSGCGDCAALGCGDQTSGASSCSGCSDCGGNCGCSCGCGSIGPCDSCEPTDDESPPSYPTKPSGTKPSGGTKNPTKPSGGTKNSTKPSGGTKNPIKPSGGSKSPSKPAGNMPKSGPSASAVANGSNPEGEAGVYQNESEEQSVAMAKANNGSVIASATG